MITYVRTIILYRCYKIRYVIEIINISLYNIILNDDSYYQFYKTLILKYTKFLHENNMVDKYSGTYISTRYNTPLCEQHRTKIK